MPICILASWDSIEKRVGEYMAAFLLMETLMIGVFAAQDLFLFYIFFEAGLIPMYLIIGIWGGCGPHLRELQVLPLHAARFGADADRDAVDGARGGQHGYPDADGLQLPPEVQTWLWLAFFASFAVKMPMWPVHTWLPDAHVQAPTAGSVILAGVLLKMGGYGFIRFSLPMFPEASAQFAWLVFGLSMVAVVYTSLVALVQSDMKKLIAIRSVAHMAIVTVGLFAFNRQGIEGAMMVMLSHGLVSGALFLCVGVIYDRLHTREIDRYGGLSINMPKYALLFMLFTMASVGLPGTVKLRWRIPALMGVYKASSWVALVATTGIILGAAYMLYLYRRICFGEQKNADAAAMPDLSPRELVMLVPIGLSVLWMGVYPESFLAPMRADVQAIVARMAPAAPEGDAKLTAGKPHAAPAEHENHEATNEHGGPETAAEAH
jgi:NADH-quinone oxidoreductase subunit M